MNSVFGGPHRHYGSKICIRLDLSVQSTPLTESNNIEILIFTLYTLQLAITSVYKPPDANFTFNDHIQFLLEISTAI